MVVNYLVTYESEDNEFFAGFMPAKRVANLYGFTDITGDKNIKAYRLSPDKDPELLKLQCAWERGVGHIVEIRTADGELIDWAHVDEH